MAAVCNRLAQTRWESMQTIATKRPVDRWSVFYLAVMLLSWVAAIGFLFLSMGGGFLGIFLNWCLGILLLLPIGFLLRDLMARRPNAKIRLALGIFTLVGLMVLSLWLIRDLAMTWHSNPVYDLKVKPSGSGFTGTRIEFHGEGSKQVIRDPFSTLRFCFGGKPNEVRIKNGQRILIFRHGAILKSWSFDFEIGGPSIETGGWMGAHCNSSDIRVDKDGSFEDSSDPNTSQ